MQTIQRIGLGVTCVLLLFGCQPAEDPSDEALVSEVLNTYTQSLVAKDIDRCLSQVSEYYSDPEHTTKEEMRDFLIAAKDSGDLDNLEVSIDEVKIVISEDGTEATASPVKIRDAIWTFTLVKDEGAWLILDGEG